jgi:hypothetical protein
MAMPDDDTTRNDILGPDAQAEAADVLMNADQPRANVVGFALGEKYRDGQSTGEPALVALVNRKLPQEFLSSRDVVPATVAGLQTDVFAVGDILAQRSGTSYRPELPLDGGRYGRVRPGIEGDGNGLSPFDEAALMAPATQAGVSSQALTRRMRPAPSGFSIGNVAITAGTLGSVVYDFLPGAGISPPRAGVGIPSKFYVLSNNHVLAASNAAPLGSAIVQPGTFDGGVDPADRIATLSRFVPIQFNPPVPLDKHNNLVDCAIGECSFQDATREIYFNGAPQAWAPRASVQVNTRLRKTGRTTNMTLGRVVGINATVDVGYGGGRVARFRDQIVTTNMSAGGDSGSLVTDWEGTAVGLLFAGSSVTTILNHIEHVRAALRVEIAERIRNAVL